MTTEQTERNFPMHDLASAPAASQAAMQWYVDNFGMVPNLIKVMAESPALLLSYWQTQTNLMQNSTLSKQEINVVEMTIAHENECQYCVAAHTALGKSPIFENTDEQLNAIRNNSPFSEPKLNVLREFTLQVARNKGRVSTANFDAFLQAGYTRAQALDIVAAIAAKTLSNFMNQIAFTPIDEAFEPMAQELAYKEPRKALAA